MAAMTENIDWIKNVMKLLLMQESKRRTTQKVMRPVK
jgi:hypothetical protein